METGKWKSETSKRTATYHLRPAGLPHFVRRIHGFVYALPPAPGVLLPLTALEVR